MKAFISVRFQPLVRSFVNSLVPPFTFFSQQFLPQETTLASDQTATVVESSECEICILGDRQSDYTLSLKQGCLIAHWNKDLVDSHNFKKV